MIINCNTNFMFEDPSLLGCDTILVSLPRKLLMFSNTTARTSNLANFRLLKQFVYRELIYALHTLYIFIRQASVKYPIPPHHQLMIPVYTG